MACGPWRASKATASASRFLALKHTIKSLGITILFLLSATSPLLAVNIPGKIAAHLKDVDLSSGTKRFTEA